MLLTGSIEARVLEVSSVSIHGDQYADVLIQTDEQVARNEASRVRVPSHAWPNGRMPTTGQRVRIEFLMQQVTSVRVL